MIPQVFHIGPLPVNSFGLMIALSLCAAVVLLQRSFSRNGIPQEYAERYVFTAGIVGLIGARIWYILERLPSLKDDLWSAIISSAGFTFYGGFIFSTIAVLWMTKRDKLRFPTLLDSIGPALTLGYLIGRVGCQLSGDGDYGMATTSWLGMSYATGVIPTPPGVLAYPTPLYESLMCLAILWFLLRIEKTESWQRPYLRFSCYLFLTATERFTIEFLRINPRLAYGLSEAQFIAIAILLVATVLYFWGAKSSREREQQ